MCGHPAGFDAKAMFSPVFIILGKVTWMQKRFDIFEQTSCENWSYNQDLSQTMAWVSRFLSLHVPVPAKASNDATVHGDFSLHTTADRQIVYSRI